MIFSGINSHLIFGFVSQASLLWSDTRLVRLQVFVKHPVCPERGRVHCAYFRCPLLCPDSSDWDFSGHWPWPHSVQTKALTRVFFSSQDQLILLPLVAANHLKATCCTQHPLLHEPQNTTWVESVQESGYPSKQHPPSLKVFCDWHSDSSSLHHEEPR